VCREGGELEDSGGGMGGLRAPFPSVCLRKSKQTLEIIFIRVEYWGVIDR